MCRFSSSSSQDISAFSLKLFVPSRPDPIVTLQVPECGYGHSFFLWEREQQSTEQQRKRKQRSTELEKLSWQVTPLEIKGGWAQGLVTGKLQRCSKGLGETLLPPASEASKDWRGSEMKPETLNCSGGGERDSWLLLCLQSHWQEED